MSQYFSLNRTFVELKLARKGATIKGVRGLNRTFVELKQLNRRLIPRRPRGLNRTFVELKLQFNLYQSIKLSS